MPATVAPPTTVNRAFREQRNLIQLQTLVRRPWHLQRADIVAKVENRRAIIFPPKDDVTGDRRSLYSQSRYQSRQ
jgi:hypothetical protein